MLFLATINARFGSQLFGSNKVTRIFLRTEKIKFVGLPISKNDPKAKLVSPGCPFIAEVSKSFHFVCLSLTSGNRPVGCNSLLRAQYGSRVNYCQYNK